jgi:hypothetical protein
MSNLSSISYTNICVLTNRERNASCSVFLFTIIVYYAMKSESIINYMYRINSYISYTCIIRLAEFVQSWDLFENFFFNQIWYVGDYFFTSNSLWIWRCGKWVSAFPIGWFGMPHLLIWNLRCAKMNDIKLVPYFLFSLPRIPFKYWICGQSLLHIWLPLDYNFSTIYEHPIPKFFFFIT